MYAFGGHGYAPVVINGCKVRVRAAAAGDAGALQSSRAPTKALSFHNSFIINSNLQMLALSHTSWALMDFNKREREK